MPQAGYDNALNLYMCHINALCDSQIVYVWRKCAPQECVAHHVLFGGLPPSHAAIQVDVVAYLAV